MIVGSTDMIVARYPVTACEGKPVQGALVYVTAVPYNMFSVPPEATTGADGWAELRMNRKRGFPATPRQQLLVMFVRARGPGGNLLGGISTRRLVLLPGRPAAVGRGRCASDPSAHHRPQQPDRSRGGGLG